MEREGETKAAVAQLKPRGHDLNLHTMVISSDRSGILVQQLTTAFTTMVYDRVHYHFLPQVNSIFLR